MENVIKTELYEELFIVDEADIFYWLAIEQTSAAISKASARERSPTGQKKMTSDDFHRCYCMARWVRTHTAREKGSSVFMVHGKSGNVKRSEQRVFLTL